MKNYLHVGVDLSKSDFHHLSTLIIIIIIITNHHKSSSLKGSRRYLTKDDYQMYLREANESVEVGRNTLQTLASQQGEEEEEDRRSCCMSPSPPLPSPSLWHVSYICVMIVMMVIDHVWMDSWIYSLSPSLCCCAVCVCVVYVFKESLHRSSNILDSNQYLVDMSARKLRGMTWWGMIQNAFSSEPVAPPPRGPPSSSWGTTTTTTTTTTKGNGGGNDGDEVRRKEMGLFLSFRRGHDTIVV